MLMDEEECEVGAGWGGGAICCDDCRRDIAASECGDGGTELRSGMAVEGGRGQRVVDQP